MTGKSVELDRTLIENLSDPLTHLVRNAVDHGIEPADERKKLGKGEIGRIKLNAYQKAGQIHIDISDDGKGIDPDQVAEAAIEKEFIGREQLETMSEKEKGNLVFSAGAGTSATS